MVFVFVVLEFVIIQEGRCDCDRGEGEGLFFVVIVPDVSRGKRMCEPCVKRHRSYVISTNHY